MRGEVVMADKEIGGVLPWLVDDMEAEEAGENGEVINHVFANKRWEACLFSQG